MSFIRHSKQGYNRFFGNFLNELDSLVDTLRKQRKNKKKVQKELLLEMEAKVKGFKSKFKNVSNGRKFFTNLNQYKNEFKVTA